MPKRRHIDLEIQRKRKAALTGIRLPFLVLALAALHCLCTPASAWGAVRGFEDSLKTSAAPPDIADTIWTDIRETGTDALLFFSGPARFDTRDWLTLGGVVVGTGLSMTADDPMRDAFADLHSVGMDRATEFGNTYGVGLPTLGIGGGLYIVGLAADASGLRRAGRHVLQSALYAAAITGTLKVLIGRHRPFLGDGPTRFEGPSMKDDFNSLPSGHTTLAFALSSTLAAEIDNPFATVGLYGLATFTAASRIYHDRHWLSDTFLGAAIGIVCGYGVVHLHDVVDPHHGGLLIVPTMNGIGAQYRF